MTSEQIERARRLIDAGGKPTAIARSFGVTYKTLWLHLARLRKTIEAPAAPMRDDA